MQNGSGKTISIWMTTAEVPQQPILSENIYADVCLVGAGMQGYLLVIKDDKKRKTPVLVAGSFAQTAIFIEEGNRELLTGNSFR
ncbi:hypothetical protein BZZ01_17165 [Nostocales cyanobacterium HT-58-2]|nr:hypothetical protein BZZ01_17165 [Nostocales cyanobacterium HT-58-2]